MIQTAIDVSAPITASCVPFFLDAEFEAEFQRLPVYLEKIAGDAAL